MGRNFFATLLVLLAGAWVPQSFAQAACASLGLLDARYCDENRDLIADQPKDPKAWQNPAIASGIHAAALGAEAGRPPDPALWREFEQRAPARPDYLLAAFTW